MSKRALTRTIRYLLLVPALAALSVGALPAYAGEDEKGQDAPAKGMMDEQAIGILKSMSAYLGKAQTLHFELKVLEDEVLDGGILIKRMKQGQATIQRPDKLMAVVQTDDQQQRRVCFNGRSLVRLLVNENTYQQLDFVGNTDALLDHLIDHYEVELPLADFLYNNVARTFEEYLVSAAYVGQRTVDGVLCHHLSFESTAADWQLWVDVGDKPVPRLFAITFIQKEHQPQYLAYFKDWEINPQVDEKIFSFQAPPGAKQVEIKQTASAAGTD